MHELDFEDDEQLQHPIIQKHKDILQKISDSRVFTICTFNRGTTIGLLECCDYCFGYDLTKEECLELSELFRELSEVIE